MTTRTNGATRRPAFDALATLSSELAGAKDTVEVSAAVQRWATSTFGDVSAGVSRRDRMGRLRLVGGHGRFTGLGRRRSARRREAFELGTVVSIELGATGRRLAIVPATVDGATVAILEVEAPAEALSRGWA